MAKDRKAPMIVGGGFIALVVTGLLGWGDLRTQQNVNTKEIPLKLDKEMFQMYAQQNTAVLTEIKTNFKDQRIEQRADMKEIKELIQNGRLPSN